MPRIPEDVIERLKREVSIETLARARGIELARHGADLIGLCPFHDDKEPSLVISPAKNLWHCLGACGAAGKSGGTAIDWVMRAEGVSFRHAVELLTSGAWSQTGTRAKHSTVRKLPAPIERDVDDAQLLRQVVSFYHETLKQSPEALSYLQKRGLTHPEMIDHFQLGFANRTLGYRLPASNRVTGAEMRGRLQKLGIIQRAAFTKQAADELGASEESVRKDLGRVLLKLEELQQEAIKKALEPAAPQIAITEDERREALSLLQDPALLDRILQDFARCGVVGEETNKLVGYLAAVSRRLESPLAVVVQSSTAAGKSSLMDAVLNFVPAEERIQYSAMTGQSLYYMGEMDLKHKVLAIAEEDGASRAAYALKLLQSEGVLSIASTGKDPATGRLVTHQYRVEGPVMIFLTTTAIDLDEELLNRCLVLTVDEDRAQTQAIHRWQREQQTLEGLLQRQARQKIVQLHQNAQRLLKPLFVANPYAQELTFPDHRTRLRRDHTKYLTLIRAIALLHQHQRPLKTEQAVTYIEATREDIATADRLMKELLARSLDELPPQTRKLLALIEHMVNGRKDFRFSRRDVRDHAGWGHTQLKIHLHRLEEFEYLAVHHGGRGQSYVYELNRSGSGREKSGPSRGEVGPQAGGGRPHETRMNTGANAVLALESEKRTYAGSNGADRT